MLIVFMGTEEIITLKEGHSLNEFRLGFLRNQLQSSQFFVLNYGSVMYYNPWIIQHNNLILATEQSYKDPKLRLLQMHFKFYFCSISQYISQIFLQQEEWLFFTNSQYCFIFLPFLWSVRPNQFTYVFSVVLQGLKKKKKVSQERRNPYGDWNEGILYGKGKN